MSLKTRLFIYLSLLHLALLVVAYLLLKEQPLIFLGVQVLVLLSAGVGIKLIGQVYAPLKMMLSGIDALKDKDFNIKFLPKGSHEFNTLVGTYNALIDQLRDERTRQQEQHYFLEQLLEASPIGIMLLNLDEEIAQVNPALCRLLQLEEQQLLGYKLSALNRPLLQQLATLPAGEAVNQAF